MIIPPVIEIIKIGCSRSRSPQVLARKVVVVGPTVTKTNSMRSGKPDRAVSLCGVVVGQATSFLAEEADAVVAT
jgi:hypothetical protein